MGKGWKHAVLGLSLVVLGGCAHAGSAPPADPVPANVALLPAASEVSTGATQTVRMGRNDPSRYASVAEFLQGRVAGLEVLNLGNGRFSLRIRGATSVNMSTEPLVVIDGVQVSPDGISNALAGVAPNEIKEVQVLKDAGSTAFYGIRGANGVILITTKRGPDD